MEKCTLYFNFIDKYNHNCNLPIINLTLKEMDYYTCSYNSYFSLYNNLPEELRNFISKEKDMDLNTSKETDLKKCFNIIDENDEECFILLSDDIDVTYVTPDELIKQMVDSRIRFEELLDCFKKSPKSINKKRYEFFTYLYDRHVKDKKVLTMMDTYDIEKRFPMIKGDDLIISSIATDKDNIIVLAKKIGQISKDRRNLAYKYKKLLSDIKSDAKVLDDNNIINRKLYMKDIDKDILKNFEKFKKEYSERYFVS